MSILIGYHQRCIVPSGVYWMNNIFLCRVSLKLIVWEEFGLRVVASIDFIVEIVLPDS